MTGTNGPSRVVGMAFPLAEMEKIEESRELRAKERKTKPMFGFFFPRPTTDWKVVSLFFFALFKRRGRRESKNWIMGIFGRIIRELFAL